jgi:hypothetical protein
MSIGPISPPSPIQLTPAQVAAMKQAATNIALMLSEFDKAESCGINCQELRQAAADTQTRISTTLSMYDPSARKPN